jgi:hypothetical protein
MPAEQEFAVTLPCLQKDTDPDGTMRIRLTGAWLLGAILANVDELRPQLAAYAKDPQLVWDLRDIQQLDAAGALFLWRIWGRRKPRVIFKTEYEPLFANLAARETPRPPQEQRDALKPLLALGQGGMSLGEHLYVITLLAGDLLLTVLHLGRYPSRIPWREISAMISNAKAASANIARLADDLQPTVKTLTSLTSHANRTLQRLDPLLVNLSSFSEEVRLRIGAMDRVLIGPAPIPPGPGEQGFIRHRIHLEFPGNDKWLDYGHRAHVLATARKSVSARRCRDR